MDSSSIRIGQGFDIHRLAENHKLILGGIHITESTLGCIAHSDGDVLVHALIDALLGALALGDIGDHFPPSDPQYKDADSMQLLQQVMALITKAGYQLTNLDSTIFLESPKLKHYKAKIQSNLANALNLTPASVSVKAKTAEKLGAIGHNQAIAASVTLLLEKL